MRHLITVLQLLFLLACGSAESPWTERRAERDLYDEIDELGIRVSHHDGYIDDLEESIKKFGARPVAADTGWTEMDTLRASPGGLSNLLGTKYLRFIVSPSSPEDSVVVHWYGAGGPPPTAKDSLKVAVDLLKRCRELITPDA
ncbi:hypothetical protein LCGC14_1284470, partial [marine sediment metagenome]